MKYLWPVVVVLAALAVAVVVLAALNLRSHADPIAPAGDDLVFDLSELSRTVWVAGIPRTGSDGGREALDELWRRLPAGVRPVTFVVTGEGPAPDGLVFRGAAGEIRRFAARRLGFPAERTAALAGGEVELLVATVDGSGRVRGRHALGPAAAAGTSRGIEAVLAEVDFLRSLAARPLLHARLNAASAAMLITGFVLIRRRWKRSHLACMVLAGATTVAFLVSYLYYHYYAGSMPFAGQGWSRPVYFAILLTHTVLAALVAPLAIGLYTLAARRRFDRHRRLARWVLPMWLYVSVSGVLIYCMLYLWFAPA